jgi:hypothetical protein
MTIESDSCFCLKNCIELVSLATTVYVLAYITSGQTMPLQFFQTWKITEFQGSKGSCYGDLGYDTTETGTRLPRFWRNISHPEAKVLSSDM